MHHKIVPALSSTEVAKRQSIPLTSAVACHKLFYKGVGRYLLAVLIVLLTVGLGSVTKAWSQTRTYVTNAVSNTVAVFDTTTNTLLTTVPVGRSPLAVAITPDGTRA